MADRSWTEYSMHIVHRFNRPRIDRDDQVAGLEARDGRRCVGFDVHDFHRALTGQPEMPGEAPLDRPRLTAESEVRSNDSAMCQELWNDPHGRIDRDCKADSLGHREDGGIDTDDATVRIDEWATRVAGVQSHIGLNDVVDEAAGRAAERAADGAHHTCR